MTNWFTEKAGGIFKNNIRFRFLSVMSLILFVSTLVLSSVIAFNEGRVLRESLRTNTQNLASYIAKMSKDALVANDLDQLDAIVKEANKDDIIYTVISDEKSTILTSQFASINYRSPQYLTFFSGISRDSDVRDIIAAIREYEPVTEVYAPIMVDIKTIGKVTIGISNYRIRQQTLRTALYVIGLNILVAVILGAVLFIASKKMILDPITALSRSTSALSDGDFTSRVNVNTSGEVKLLVDRFNNMLDNLEKVTVSKDYVDTIINSMTDTLLVVSTDHKILLANRAVLGLTGYTEDEVIGKPVEMIFSKNAAASAMMLDEIKSKGHVSNAETVYRTKDGKLIDMLVSGSTMASRNGMYGIICVAKDMTDRKRAEEDKQKLQYQLIQAQKMESVGQLAGGIAHDFNNILTAIIGNCDIIQTKVSHEDSVRPFVDYVLTAARRAADLVKSLLAFSRMQVINPMNMDVNDVVRKAKKFLERLIGENIELRTSLSDSALIIFADMTQMEQVVINLATNARDAMPGGGQLFLHTEHAILDDSFRRKQGFGAPGSYACLTVSDSGCGIDAQIRGKIFDPFFTTKEVGKGTGLGLSTVYGIIKQNGGYITVDSAMGRGTVFKIYMPLISSVVESRISSPEQHSAQNGTETILVAEDDEPVRMWTSNILVEHGYSVIEAADGEDALKKFEQNIDSIHLLLIDVVMPKLNGKELYQAAKKMKPDVKALFVSGYPTDLVRDEGVLEKGLNFISKPSSRLNMLSKIRHVLDQ